MKFRKDNTFILIALCVTVVLALISILLASKKDDPVVETYPSEPNIIESTAETVCLEETVPETKPIYYHYTEEEIEMLAQLLWSECRGVPSTTRQACVAWVVCNRVDSGEYDSISDAITAAGQFAWYSYDPVTVELYWLAQDVLVRWNYEKNGVEDVGRVIPSDYLWFHGEYGENYFRNGYSGNFDVWDYSLPSPYED